MYLNRLLGPSNVVYTSNGFNAAIMSIACGRSIKGSVKECNSWVTVDHGTHITEAHNSGWRTVYTDYSDFMALLHSYRVQGEGDELRKIGDGSIRVFLLQNIVRYEFPERSRELRRDTFFSKAKAPWQ